MTRRPSITPLLATTLAGVVALSACSPDAEAPAGQSTSPTSSTTPAPPDDAAATTQAAPKEPIRVDRSVGEARDLARAFYSGDDVAMDRAVAKAVPDRVRALHADEARRVRGGTGTWGGTDVAVLTSGDDVTLAIRAKGDWKVVGGWWPSLEAPDPVPHDPRTVLLVGSDARPGQEVGRSRGDALQLVSTDGRTGGAVVGIPRDSWVAVPGHGSAKINAALVLGGPDLLADTVADATGVEVDGYVVVGFDDFKGLIDDVGGLPIVLDSAMTVMWAHLPQGDQLLTGAKALAFARERKRLAGGDFDRSAHQGDLVLAALDLARQQGPEKLPRLMSALDERTLSDLDAREALTLLARVYLLDPHDVEQAVAQGPTGWSSDGQSIVRWDSGTRSLFTDLRDGRLDD